MSIKENLNKIKNTLPPHVKLIAVSKFHPIEAISEAYSAPHLVFGENKVQEMKEKYELLPKDIEWHMIGHLQSNKVKYIIPFVHLIHSIDSEKLLTEVQKQAQKLNKKVNVLLQFFIADEETKYGLNIEEAIEISKNYLEGKYPNIEFCGVMGMASFSKDESKIRSEFKNLKKYFLFLKENYFKNNSFKEISMGMSSDYKIAIEEGSTIIRVGSSIFGIRNY